MLVANTLCGVQSFVCFLSINQSDLGGDVGEKELHSTFVDLSFGELLFEKEMNTVETLKRAREKKSGFFFSTCEMKREKLWRTAAAAGYDKEIYRFAGSGIYNDERCDA
jgi:hypothetical protein